MFTKILKYDFMFSRAIFFGMAAVMLGVAASVKISSLFLGATAFDWLFGIAGMITIVMAVVGTASQFVLFFYKNFFDNPGYLMLTLPVSRGRLLASKIITSFVWLLFMLTVGLITIFIFALAQDPDLAPMDFFNAFNLIDIMTFVNIVFVTFFIQIVLFLAVALSHSTFGRRQMSSLIAGIIAFVYAGAALGGGAALTARRSEWVTRQYIENIYDEYGYIIGSHGWSHFGVVRDTGLRIGRIAIGETGAYIDIFFYGMILGMTALAIFTIYFLLKGKASLA